MHIIVILTRYNFKSIVLFRIGDQLKKALNKIFKNIFSTAKLGFIQKHDLFKMP